MAQPAAIGSAIVVAITNAPTAKPKEMPFYLGGLAAMGASACTAPVDLLKVRLQTNYDGKSRMWRSAVEVVQKDGFLALYDGLSASLLRQATYSTVRFGVYEALKQQISERTGQKQLSLAYTLPSSLFAGMMGGLAGNPADLINVRMQADRKLPPEKQRHYRHAIDGLVRISREEGVGGLFTGVRPHVVRAMLMTASQLATYDSFKRAILSTGYFNDNLFTHLLASTSSGIVATVVTAPVDIVKTRMMSAAANRYRGALDCATQIARHEGIFGFYKGFVPAFVRLGPHTVLTFVFFEQLKQLWS